MSMNRWLEQWFSAQSANGGVIRRSAIDVDQYASLDDVIDEARKRNWHVIETGDQIVILCHDGALHLHC